MKQIAKISLIILTLIASLMLVRNYLLNNHANEYDDQLFVYNWGEYIDPEVLAEFEDLYNIDVVYETFDSNETLYAKLKNNNNRYDVVFPSEYMVDKMDQEHMLLPIDRTKLHNFNLLDPRLVTLGSGDVSVPYFWGTVGVIYDPNKTDLTFDSWDDLWDPSLKNEVILVDGAREVLGMALQSLGFSVNSTDPKQLALAQEKLIKLQPNVRAIIGDEVLQIMPAGEATAALTWSGSAKYMQDINPDLVYAIPQEGTNIWVDNAVIPTTCQNIDGAYKFIDFLMSTDVSYRNSDYVGYSSPNIEVKEIVSKEEDYNPIYYPDAKQTAKYEFYRNLSTEENIYYNDLFLEFKMF